MARADSIRLEPEDLAVEVSLGQGCTITRIRDRATGVDLLRHEPKPPPGGLGPTGKASRRYFQEKVFIGGWFPMFPIAGGPGSRADLRLHGEAARVPWRVGRVTSQSVNAHVVLPESGLALRREITIAGSTVSTRTLVRNPGVAGTYVSAGEHPCFDIAQLGATAVTAGTVRIELADDDEVEHIVLPASGTAALSGDRPGRDVVVSWDPSVLPGLLIWRRGRDIVGIEPKSFIGRSIDDVADRWVHLAPDATWEWSVAVRLLPGVVD